jgi:hypothetical protein
MKFLKSFIPLLLLLGYWPAQAQEEMASDPESINRESDQFQDKNLIQEEQEHLRMEKEEQEFDAFGVDEFNKNDYPSTYEDDDIY